MFRDRIHNDEELHSNRRNKSIDDSVDLEGVIEIGSQEFDFQ